MGVPSFWRYLPIIAAPTVRIENHCRTNIITLEVYTFFTHERRHTRSFNICFQWDPIFRKLNQYT